MGAGKEGKDIMKLRLCITKMNITSITKYMKIHYNNVKLTIEYKK